MFVLAATQAVIGTFFSPARTALVPRVVPVEGLLAANSLGQMTRMIAGVIGAGVTGVIAGVAGIAWPVFSSIATFLASADRAPGQPRGRRPRPRSRLDPARGAWEAPSLTACGSSPDPRRSWRHSVASR